MTLLLLLSMTLGRTLKAEGTLWSPSAKTSMSEHSPQVTFAGAWIAALTSGRSKYNGDFWTSGKEPLPSVVSLSPRKQPYRLIYSREAENIPKNGIRVEDAINIKSWVLPQSLCKDEIPKVASFIRKGRIAGKREWRRRRRVSEVLLHISGISTCLCEVI